MVDHLLATVPHEFLAVAACAKFAGLLNLGQRLPFEAPITRLHSAACVTSVVLQRRIALSQAWRRCSFLAFLLLPRTLDVGLWLCDRVPIWQMFDCMI